MKAFLKSSDVPTTFKLAIVLSVFAQTLSLLFGLIRSPVDNNSYPGWAQVLLPFASYAVGLFLISILAEGRGWIRTLSTVLMALGYIGLVILLLFPNPKIGPIQFTLRDLVIQPLQLLVVLLLWTKESSEYFRRSRLKRKNELVIYTNI